MLAVAAALIQNRTVAADATNNRALLVEAILSDEVVRQAELIKQLASANDPVIEQSLIAWRGGSLYIFETNDTRIPFLLDSATDSEGRAKGLKIADVEFLKDAADKALLFTAADLTPADSTSKLRKVIKTSLDFLALANPNPNVRRDAAIKLGLTMHHAEVRAPDDIEKAFVAMSAARAQAVLVYRSVFIFVHLPQIVAAAERHRIPTIYAYKDAVVQGGLIAYGSSLDALFKRSATYVDKILKGAPSANLPVEQPTKFQLFVNLGTAKALGLTIPPALLVRADGVIE